MDNNTENKKMMVKLTELRAWMDAGQVEFDVPEVGYAAPRKVK